MIRWLLLLLFTQVFHLLTIWKNFSSISFVVIMNFFNRFSWTLNSTILKTHFALFASALYSLYSLPHLILNSWLLLTCRGSSTFTGSYWIFESSIWLLLRWQRLCRWLFFILWFLSYLLLWDNFSTAWNLTNFRLTNFLSSTVLFGGSNLTCIWIGEHQFLFIFLIFLFMIFFFFIFLIYRCFICGGNWISTLSASIFILLDIRS